MANGNAVNRGVAKTAGFMMVMIFISRFIGFFREMIVAKIFGRGIETDAFFAAFTLPDIMYYLLVGGALSSAFIPVFTEYLATDREEEGWRMASTFINVTIILLVILTVLGVIFAPVLAPLVAYKFKGEALDLLVKLMRIMFPAVFFTATSGLMAGVLNSYQHFLAPAMGPIIYNIGIILGAVILGVRFGITGMAVGVVVGALCNFLNQFPFVAARNKGYRLKLDLGHPGFRKMLRLMIPALIGLSVTQINLLVNQNLASGLPEGSITALRFANRLMQLPLGIFAMGISTAIFPTLTRQVAKGEITDFKNTFGLGIRAVFFITLPATVGLVILREPIVRLLFEHGEFKHTDTVATAVALMYYSYGLLSQSVVQVVTRVFYALHDTATPVKIGLVTVVMNIVVNLAFLRFTDLAHGGLALAFSITGTLNMLILMFVLAGKVKGIGIKRLVGSFLKGLAASLVMGLVVAIVSREVGSVLNVALLHNLAIQVALSIGAGVVAFAVSAFALRMDEVDFVLSMVRKKIRR